ncbi:MAG: biopolymer transport protein ExbD [Rickettsiales bacterium]|jgi:biopolymer transport protein ExbD
MSFGGFTRENSSPMSEINTTPLVDVMLVLLIIFIITAPIITGSVNINLPQAQTAASPQKDEIIKIELDEKGQLFFNDQKIDEEGLVRILKIEVTKSPNVEMRLNADLNTKYKKITQIMAKANQAGITKIGFVTKIE